MSGFKKKISLLVSWGILVSLFFPIYVEADELECDTIEECKALLQEYEEEIEKYQGNIEETRSAKQTLQNKIYYLHQKIDQLAYEIRRSNIIINDLETQLSDTEQSIKNTEQKIEKSREQLAQMMQKIYEEEQKSSLEIFLASKDLSDFFEDVFALENLLGQSYELLNQIKKLKSNLENQKEELGEKQEDWLSTKQMQILQKEESRSVKSEQEWLLEKTKGEEAEYQRLLEENKRKAQEIRQRIFSLIGVPEAPTFGEALEIARYVEDVTGVRAALLLAVLRQESDIGKNVGQCYLKNFETGSGIVASTGEARQRVMNPSRDVAPFRKVCEQSGRNPKNTLVSCPMSFGWGGAMGPAQFIPSTWIIYNDRVGAITGRPADPWNINDAFLAAGLYLKDAGAAKGTYNGEYCAAMVYFSGSCSSGYDFYGRSVMNLAAQYEEDITQMERFSYR